MSGFWVEGLEQIREPLCVERDPQNGKPTVSVGFPKRSSGGLVGVLPPIFPEWLGGNGFRQTHRTRFAYAAGSMANGIATPELVESLAGHGMLGFFGAAGLPFERVEAGVAQIASRLSGRGVPWGANLIHSPHEPALEMQSARLFLEREVPCIEASAYMTLTSAVVLAGMKGIASRPDGSVVRPRALFVKLSRPEVAQRFLVPPPANLLNDLLDQKLLTQDEAQLAATVPLATDVTVEADSGGHTDNRPLAALLPAIRALWEEIRSRHRFDIALRIGAAGGLGTPSAVAAAFALGADYVVTGSLNQGAVESGLSTDGKAMLARAELADVAMAAAADMFELGVKVQVLRRGTLFAARANRLYELYRSYESIEAFPDEIKKELEEIFRSSLDSIWGETQDYWLKREPEQAARALYDPHHKMALVFRWYLGMASRWAIQGDESRRGDYQIWCGPAMGAFNTWTKGSFLESPSERTVVQIGLNLLEGAAVITRAQQLRACGVEVPSNAFCYRPRRLGLG